MGEVFESRIQIPGYPYAAYKLPYLGTPDADPHSLVKSVADQGGGVTRVVLDAATATLNYSAPPDNAVWQQVLYDMLGNVYSSPTWQEEDVLVVQRIGALLDTGALMGHLLTWNGAAPSVATLGFGAHLLRNGAGLEPTSWYYRGGWAADATGGTADATARVMESFAAHYAYSDPQGYNRPYVAVRATLDGPVLDPTAGGDGAGSSVAALFELDTCNVVASCNAALGGDATIDIETWLLIKNRADRYAREGMA